MTRLFTKENMARLSPEERSHLMFLQMSPSSLSNDGYLPDDCSYCGACGYPVLGAGRCDRCNTDWDRLVAKMQTGGGQAGGTP